MTITPADHVRALLATPVPFRSWLAKHRKGARVGRRAEPCQCPIAEYLMRSGIEDACVYPDQIEIGRESLETPAWARMFIHLIDMDSDAEDQRPITRDEALEALEESSCKI